MLYSRALECDVNIGIGLVFWCLSPHLGISYDPPATTQSIGLVDNSQLLLSQHVFLCVCVIAAAVWMLCMRIVVPPMYYSTFSNTYNSNYGHVCTCSLNCNVWVAHCLDINRNYI